MRPAGRPPASRSIPSRSRIRGRIGFRVRAVQWQRAGPASAADRPIRQVSRERHLYAGSRNRRPDLLRIATPRPVLSPKATASASLAAAPTFPLNPGSPLVQQCRRLAGVLHDRQVERGLKRVAIASAVDTDGKAHIAVHLALTLSRTYANRVLLIDADTRQPFVHELVGGPNDVGLSDALRGDRRESRSFGCRLFSTC